MFKKLIGGILFLLLISMGAGVYAQDNNRIEGSISKSNGNIGTGLTMGELSGVLNTDQKVTDFINGNQLQFGIQNKANKLMLTKKKVNKKTNKKHYLYQLTHKGIPVYGNYTGVHLNNQNKVYAVDNDVNVKAINLPTSPSLSEAQAIANLTAAVEKELGKKIELGSSNEMIQVKEPSAKLIIYPSGGKHYLAYETKISFLKPAIGEWIGFVDAHTGQIIEKYNALKDSSATEHSKEKKMPLRSYTVEQGKGDSNNGDVKNLNIVKENGRYLLVDTTNKMANGGAIVTAEWKGLTEDEQYVKIEVVSSEESYFKDKQHAVDAHYNADIVYDYYKEEFDRDSIDGNGMDILSIVNVPDLDGGGGALDNAYWSSDAMWYGDGSGSENGFNCLSCAVDVVGHELTHGVIEKTADLYYWQQSGALNESFADIMGSLIDGNWEIGEDTGTVIRDMEDPNRYDQPKHMSEYMNVDWDNGGVHYNSGIPNFAAYQLATSLDQRGLDGKKILGHITYNSLNYYLHPFSQFTDARDAFLLSVDDLTFLGGSQKDIVRNEVTKAWAAVGLPFADQESIFKGKVIFKNGLTLTVDDELYVEIRNTDFGNFESIQVAGDGTFSKRLSPGNYVIDRVSKYNRVTEEWEEFGINQKFVIEPNKDTTQDIVINEYNVAGIVTESETNTPITIGEVEIEFTNEEGDLDSYWALIKDGTFKLTVPNGKYRISAIWLGDGTRIEQNQEFEINDNKIDNLRLTVPPVSFVGQVKLPLEDVNFNDLFVDITIKKDDEYYYVSPNEEGVFNLRLPKGDYTLESIYVYDYTSGEEKTYYVNEPFKIDGNTALKEFVIKPDNFSGKLTLDNSASYNLGEGYMEIESLENNQYYSFEIDEEGNFLGRLPQGKYKITHLEIYEIDLRFFEKQEFDILNEDEKTSISISVPKLALEGEVILPEDIKETGIEYAYLTLANENNKHEMVQLDADQQFAVHMPAGEYKIVNAVFDLSTNERRTYSLNEPVSISANQEEPHFKTITLQTLNLNLKGNVAEEGTHNTLDIDYMYIVNKMTKKVYDVAVSEDGTFSTSLPTGDYVVQSVSLFNEEHEHTQVFINQHFSITNEQETTNLEVRIPPENVNGDIRFENGFDIADLASYNHRYLIVKDNENNGIYLPVNEDGTFTGRFVLGAYQFVELYGVKNESDEHFSFKLDQEFEVKQNAITNVTVTVKKSGGGTGGGAGGSLDVGQVKENSTAVTGVTEPGMTIEIHNESKKIGTGKSKSDGHFSVKIPKQKLGTILTVVVKDAHGNLTAETEIEVQDGTPPEAPKVDRVTDQSAAVTGTTEADAIITVKAGANQYTGEANDQGTFEVAVARLKAGTTIFVTAADKDENVSKETKVVVLDGTAPDAPVVNPVKESDKAVTGTAEPGATVIVSYDGKVLKSGKADKNGKFSVSVKMPVKDAELSVTVKDAAGNESAAATVIVQDGKAPDAPIVDSVTDKMDKVTGTAEEGAVVKAVVKVKEGRQTVEQEIGRGTAVEGVFTIEIDAQPAGTTIYLTAIDAVGNVSKETTAIVLDGTAPDAPVVNPVKESDKAVTGTAEAGATVIVSYDGKVLKSGKADKNGKFSVSVKMPAKDAELSVTVKDAAGNESAAATVIVQDGKAPDAPIVDRVTDKMDKVTGTAEEGAVVKAVVKVKEGRQTVEQEIGRGTAVEGVFTIEIDAQPAGTTIYLTAIDAVGNVSKETTAIVLDGTAPDAPVVNPVKESDKAVTGTAEPGATVIVSYDGKVLKSGKADKNGKFSVSVKMPAKDAELSVTVKDAAGNESAAATVIVQDGKAPDVPTVEAVTDQDEVVTGKAEAGAVVKAVIKVKEGRQTVEQEIGRGIATEEGFAVEIEAQPAGTTIYLTAIDAVGNISKETKVVVLDRTAPDAPMVDDITSMQKVVTGKTEPNVTVTVKNEAEKVLRSGKSNKNGEFKLSISPQPAGSVIYVTATDSAKNVSEATVKVVSSLVIE